LDKLKTLPYKFVTNSYYTKGWLKRWGINSEVLYPYLDNAYINIDSESLYKKDMILSVGRFFKHLHSKQHKEIITAFENMKKNNEQFKNYKLVLAGGLKDEDQDYFDSLQELINDNESIKLMPNLSFDHLFRLYQSARFFWHFTGFGVDPDNYPERLEHLGITPLEAMACGCITFAYDAGGPQEIIETAKTGYLFDKEEGLFEQMKNIVEDETKQYHIKLKAKSYIKKNFSYKKFDQRVNDLCFV
jgi:glycosyltransferase involved in cell wall biosynthesis